MFAKDVTLQGQVFGSVVISGQVSSDMNSGWCRYSGFPRRLPAMDEDCQPCSSVLVMTMLDREITYEHIGHKDTKNGRVNSRLDSRGYTFSPYILGTGGS